jgi:hypothetical protein
MKYISVDRLSDFEFHDAEMHFISRSENDLTVSVKCLNIHKGTAQNSHPTDMEIADARLTFRSFSLSVFDPGDEWTQDAEGKWVVSVKGCISTDAAAEQRFLNALKSVVTIFAFDRFDDASYFIDGSSQNEPWFTVRFTFASVTIEWDEYLNPAWYEAHQQSLNAN